MTELTRRNVMTSAAGLGAALLSPLLAAPGQAAAPPVGKQAPGFYRYKVGSHEVTVVSDGATTRGIPDGYVRNASKEEVNAALAADFMEPGKLMTPYTPIVVNTGPKLVVIDPGWGPAFLERSKGELGQFHRNLAASGIDRNAVDSVLISHCHGDHVNGLLTADNKPAFPNAEILVPSAEWKFWSNDGNRSAAPAQFDNNRRVFGALGNKVTHYEAGQEVAPGIVAFATYGHSPGHTAHIIASGSSKVFVQGDMTTNSALLFVRNPGWHVMYDMDASAAEATRRKTYDMLAAERMPIQGFHFPFPSLGYVEKVGAGYRVIPIPWNPSI